MEANSSADAAAIPSSVCGTQTIQRAALLLRLLTNHSRTGLRLVDLAALSKIERSTVHRMLHGLIAEGFVAQDQASKRYYLGPALYEMGLAASPKNRLRDICQPYLQWITAKTGATVFLTVRSGFDGVCLDRKNGVTPIDIKDPGLDFDVGQHRPLGIGTGCMALLSALPNDMVDRIISVNDQRQAFASESITLRQLRQQIAQTRETGYATRTLPTAPSVSALGLIIPVASGGSIGAVSIRELSRRLQGRWKDQLVCILRRAAADIGYMVQKNLHGRDLDSTLPVAQ